VLLQAAACVVASCDERAELHLVEHSPGDTCESIEGLPAFPEGKSSLIVALQKPMFV
jgi:hypothetical protein